MLYYTLHAAGCVGEVIARRLVPIITYSRQSAGGGTYDVRTFLAYVLSIIGGRPAGTSEETPPTCLGLRVLDIKPGPQFIGFAI